MKFEKDQRFQFPRKIVAKIINLDDNKVYLKEEGSGKELSYSISSLESLIKFRVAKPI